MKIELKPWTLEDQKELARLCHNADRQFLSDRLPYPYTEENARWWIGMAEKQEGKEGIFRAILADGKIVGNISVEKKADVYRRDGEIGYMLKQEYNSRGIMTEAVTQICPLAYKELDLIRITGLVYAPNTPSRKVLEKNGFVLEGVMKKAVTKGGRTFDLCIYGKCAEKQADENAEPESRQKDGYILRLARKEDAEEYYKNNFQPFDPETARLTGSRTDFSHDEVVGFLKKCVEDKDRYDFLIFSPQGKIIGESVLNEIDWELRKANFRIALFHPEDCGKGIGSWAIRHTLDFAFREVKLHRVELDVFSFNPRAIRAYEKAGFRREGILRDAVKDGDKYGDDILMAILEEEWR